MMATNMVGVVLHSATGGATASPPGKILWIRVDTVSELISHPLTVCRYRAMELTSTVNEGNKTTV